MLRQRQARRHGRQLRGCHSRFQCDIETRDANATRIGAPQTKKTLEHRGFTRATRADKRNDFARSHLKLERVEHHATAVAMSEIISAEHGDQMKGEPAGR
jgi:hypothetical protein